jgi:hypothetical protein
MPKVRIPLEATIESRDTTLDKDSLTTNAFVEQSAIGNYTIKRPGLEVLASALGRGLGGLWYNGSLYRFAQTNVKVSANTNYRFLAANATSILGVPDSDSLTIANEDAKLGFISNDLKTYTNTTLPIPLQYFNPFWTGQAYLAIGRYPSVGAPWSYYIVRSDDGGVSWNEFQITLPDNWQITSNFIMIGTFVYAYTRSLDTPFQSGYIRSDNNGRTWTHFTLPYNIVNDNIFINTIARNPSRYTSGMAYSTAGVVWTACTNPQNINSLVWTGSVFIGVSTASGNIGTYAKSSDGISWTTHSNHNPPGLGSFNKVIHTTGGLTVMWGGAGIFFYSTDSGDNWSDDDVGTFVFTPVAGTGQIRDIVASGTQVYVLWRTALGNYWLFNSSDGINWSGVNMSLPFYDYNPDIIFMD